MKINLKERYCDRGEYLLLKVCLDGTVTTEKELDTVEVLKAIQKAKEAKDRMANPEKKVRALFMSCLLLLTNKITSFQKMLFFW